MAAVGGGRGGAHLARVAAAGAREVAEGGDGGGSDRGDRRQRAGAVGPPCDDLGGPRKCSATGGMNVMHADRSLLVQLCILPACVG